MTQNSGAQTNIEKRNMVFLPILFILVAIIGLFYVKWNPYYAKVLLASSKHAIGTSIVTGKSSTPPAFSWGAAVGYAAVYFKAVWKAVVLGLLLGSLVQVAIPRNWIKKLYGDSSLKSTAAAGVTALPGMMCTCCAAPVAVGLRKRSASVSSALAFFLANPVLNPATIIFMGFVLSWKFAIFRIVMGLILVLSISSFANKFIHDEDIKSADSFEDLNDENVGGNFIVNWLKALWQLIIDTIPAYLIFVFLLGAARIWLFPAIGEGWANSIFAIIILAVTGTLFVIPTAAEIPIVQTLMAFGLGAGPAAALIITLPAVSVPSLLIIKRAFPTRVLLFVASSVAVLGIIGGILGSIIL